MKRHASPSGVDITATLPRPQPNYRPLPQRHCSVKAYQGERKDLTSSENENCMKSRKCKTSVYSGKKNNCLTTVPSLVDCCTRVLIKNIQSIEDMGEVPYDLVKQVLERCSPVQLQQIENFNPHLLNYTHELWEGHCKRSYHAYVRKENETWHDSYWRIYEEQKERLKSVTSNVAASVSNYSPARQIKLAYVDSVVKLPHDVAHRRTKHSTIHPANHTEKTGTSSKAVPKSTPSTTNTTTSSGSCHHANAVYKKRKMPPLMAKSLKNLRNMSMAYRH